MEDKGVPTVRDVITKLKSDGTFDNFRKSCANSIENEPLFRAQKEEVEVLSRKFLQRSHWDDKTLKSDVRVHLKNYVLNVLHRPEAINQLGFIAEKILSRKHKEFMTQINEVTHSLQGTASSSYRDDYMSYDGVRKEPVKATETAVDLLQSFAISTPSTVKKASGKPLKHSKPPSNQDAPTAVNKEGSSVVIKNDARKELENVEDDDVGVRQSKQCKQHNMTITSSSEEVDNDGVDCDDTVMSSVDRDKYSNDVDNSFTTLLHHELYPCHKEEPEVKWTSRPPPSTTPVVLRNDYKQYSCFIHPAAPWQRCKRLHQHSRSNIAEVSCSSAALKDKYQEVFSDEKNQDEKTAKQRDRIRKKRKREIEYISSDSETESLKISDNAAANKQVEINPPETRTSKRVRRAPIKLRQ